MKIRIGTRGSALALWQADEIARRLQQATGAETERTIFKTTGDAILDRPLAEVGGKGLFTKELEVALMADEIDIAVHSLKDMPTVLPPGLVIGAVPTRGDVRDCIVTRRDESVEPAVVGTASLRRSSLASRRWPRARIEPIRGNVKTRLDRLVAEGERRVDAVILAMAGLLRLEYPQERDDLDFLPLNPELWIPAVGQGALAVECREDDEDIRQQLLAIHDDAAASCTDAERAFLRGVEGDCRVPVGAHATIDRGEMRLRAFVGDPAGSQIIVRTAMGVDAHRLGADVARSLLDDGGREILNRLRIR